MTKEMFKEYIRECGGIEELVELREKTMNLVCSIDEVIKLESTIDTVEYSEGEIFRKVANMVILMSEFVD